MYYLIILYNHGKQVNEQGFNNDSFFGKYQIVFTNIFKESKVNLYLSILDINTYV